MASAGAGRPVNKDGYADGPWTPDLLVNALGEVEYNEDGVELRTVQRWFQENEHNIGLANMQLLARVFGCGDPIENSNWQWELNRSRLQMISERKQQKTSEKHVDQLFEQKQPNTYVSASTPSGISPAHRFNLASRTGLIFSSESSLPLPLFFFTGACALALISFTMNIHSVVFTPSVGVPKQVGFLWAPNWTIVFLFLLPLFLSLLTELTRSWTTDWRNFIASVGKNLHSESSWHRNLQASSYSLWITFFITIVIASGYNWIATHLMPLLNSAPGGWPIDWGRIAIVRPDIVSVPSAVIFSGLVFLYNGLAAYFFFAGHIFLLLLKQDYVELIRGVPSDLEPNTLNALEDISFGLMNSIYRCTALGTVITIMMKLQSEFLHSGSANIVQWLIIDARSVLGSDEPNVIGLTEGIAPGFYYSFFCLLAIAGTFLNCAVRIRCEMIQGLGPHAKARFRVPWGMMIGSMVLLIISYFLIGIVQGFSLFLLFALALTGYYTIKSDTQWVQANFERST